MVVVRPPAGPIQLPPAGLLSLLDIKSSGDNPNALLQTVQPTIDVLELYAYPQRRIRGMFDSPATGAGVVSTWNASQQLLVPASERWFIYNCTVSLSIAAADTFAGALTLLRAINAGGLVYMSEVSERATITGGASGDILNIEAKNFWAGPTDLFLVGYGLLTNTSTTSTIVLTCEYTPFKF